MKLLIIPGSLRKDSFNKKLAYQAEKIANEMGFKTTLLEPLSLNLPILNQDDSDQTQFCEEAKKLKKMMQESDAFLFITPEYNGSISGYLKNLIDWASRPAAADEPIGFSFHKKVAALMSASMSPIGGLRALLHLRDILSILNTVVIPQEKTIPSAHETMKDEMSFEKHFKGIKRVLESLYQTTQALSGR